MKMGQDAENFLLNIVPIVLRINVFIVNINTSQRAKDGAEEPIVIQENKAKYDDISLKLNDQLNFHDKMFTINVLRKDGHYDLLYKNDYTLIMEIKDFDKEFTPKQQEISSKMENQF